MEDFLIFIASILGIQPSELSENTSYGSIDQWDSLMHIRLVSEIEDKYDVDIPMEEIAKIRSLKDFYKYTGK